MTNYASINLLKNIIVVKLLKIEYNTCVKYVKMYTIHNTELEEKI